MGNDFSHLSDAELNEQLQQLLETALAHRNPSLSPTAKELTAQRLAKNRFIMAIQKSGRLSKQAKWHNLENFPDIYAEALQQTLLEIWEKADTYNAAYPVMAWVNQTFNWRFQDTLTKYRKQGMTQAPQKIPCIYSLEDLNREIEQEPEDITPEEQLREIVRDDRGGYLRSETIKGSPQASLQVIILLLLEGKKWREISEELQAPISSLSSFYQRRLVRKIIPYLQQYL